MEAIDIAWLAGLYEGEGTAYTQTKQLHPIKGKSTSTTVRVSICMTDRDIIDRVNDLFPSPSGVTSRQRGADHYKEQYEWRIGRRDDVSRFLHLILPFLGERRTAQALKVLAVADDQQRGLGSGRRYKTHCSHGHIYDDSNTSYDSQGYRVCKECKRIQTRDLRAKKRS